MIPAAVPPGALAASLGRASDYLVVVDFDGTLAPIVDRPDDAHPVAGAVEALTCLAACTTVAVLSGRPLEQLLDRVPAQQLLLVGGHGAQVREPAGRQHDLIDVASVAATLDRAESEVRVAVDDGTGWLVERKIASLAVHHRLVPEDEEAALLPRIAALLDARREDPPGFDVLQGKAVLELRPSGIDKGQALAWLLDREPGRRPLVFGDDHTDEDAFSVAVQRGGRAVVVGDDPRPTVATDRLHGPSEVADTLAELARRAKA